MVTPGKPLGPGQIYDSNRSTLLASLSEHGFPSSDLGIASDDRESLVRALKRGLAANDVLVTSGGVSMGEKVRLSIGLVTVHAQRITASLLEPVHVGFSVPTCDIEHSESGLGMS